MNLGKKILVLGVVLSMVVSMAGPAAAETVEELQAQITALLAQLSALQTQLGELGGETGTGECPCTFTRNLYPGITGADVKCLQEYLNDEGYTVASSGAGSSGNETTYYGPLTQAAVKKWQDANDVSYGAWGGYFGPISQAAYDASCAVVVACSDQENQEDCEDADCYWYDSACNEEELVCSDYEEEDECPADCYWYDDACNVEAPVCADYTAEADCTAADCYWYDAVCNQEEEEIPTADLTVELDENTPAAGAVYIDTTVPAGSANNLVTKVKFTAGPNAVTISGMTVTKYGTAGNGAVDIARIKVYDGNTQLGSRVLVTNKATFVITPNVKLDPGDSKVLDLVVDLTGAAASVTRTLALGVAAAADVTATGSAITPTGEFPIVGNYMTISQGTFGNIAVTPGVNPPATVPAVGENDRVLGNFIISAGANEDLTLVSMTLTDNGTTADGDITDIKVKAGTEELGTIGAFSNRRAVIALAKDVLRGNSVTVQVTGDITSGVGRLLTLTLVAPDAIVAKGKTSGVSFVGPAANIAMPATGVFTGGVLTVTPNVNSPTDNLVSSPVPRDIGIFDVRGTGENVVIQAGTFTFTHSAAFAAAYNVGLFDQDGGLVSNIVAIPAAGSAGSAFVLSWTIPVNTTKELHIKAYTNVLAVGDAAKTITVGVGALLVTGVGEQSGAAVTAPAAGFALPAITYRHTGSLQFALNTVVAPINQAALTSTAVNYWTAMIVIATREDVTITSLRFNDLIAETTAAFTTCSLYDMATDGTLTNLDTQVWNFVVGVGNSNVVFNRINSGAGITIPMGAANAKNFVVKCSVSGAATNANAPELDVLAGGVTATGAISSIAVPVGNIVLPALTGAETRGKHTIFTIAGGGVLYVKPNASAFAALHPLFPDISRSSTATVGIWDLTAKGVAAIAFDNVGAGTGSALVFTSFTGGILAGSVTFRLVDATTGTAYAVSNGGENAATATTVTFNDADFATGAAQLVVLQDAVTSVKLQENITSTVNYPQYTALQFGFANAAAIDTRANGGGAAVNNAGGLVGYPAEGIQAKCPEVRIQ